MRANTHLRGRVSLLCAAISAFYFVSCGPKAVQQDFIASSSAVERFHAQLDSGRFGQIYTSAAPELKSADSEADFIQLLAAVHRKLGRFESDSEVGFSEEWHLHEGLLVRLDYETRYADGKAKEHFVWRAASSGATLVSYRIDSRALIVR